VSKRGGNRKNLQRSSQRWNKSAVDGGDPVLGLPTQVAAGLTVAQSTSVYSGPIPPPEILRGYEEIVPGAAKTILGLWELQTTHRTTLEARALGHNIWRSWAGIISAFLIAMVGLGGGIFLAYNGHDTAGAAIAGTSLVGLVSTFLYGTYSVRQERIEKNAQMRRK
jgi:uncharacterized membrane protein